MDPFCRRFLLCLFRGFRPIAGHPSADNAAGLYSAVQRRAARAVSDGSMVERVWRPPGDLANRLLSNLRLSLPFDPVRAVRAGGSEDEVRP